VNPFYDPSVLRSRLTVITVNPPVEAAGVHGEDGSVVRMTSEL
jgi:hypothetical protein